MLSFVLSGGGSRGALQVGALQALLEEGIRPDMMVGTSIGAINSVWFAANPTLQGVETLRKLYATLMVDDFFPGGNKFAALNLVLQMPHLFANDRFRQLLEEHLPVKTFGELALPCYVVATDMDSGENRVFGDNPDDRIIDGLMSSTAMTPLHPSWEVDGRVYACLLYTSILPTPIAQPSVILPGRRRVGGPCPVVIPCVVAEKLNACCCEWREYVGRPSPRPTYTRSKPAARVGRSDQ